MQYAVIAMGGKQYKVGVGDEILIDRVSWDENKPYFFEKVLLLRNDQDIKIGSPYVTAAKVKGKVVSDLLGEKITTSKFKAKVHYRRKIGFRPRLTKIKIEEIIFANNSAPSAKGREKLLTHVKK